jgi:DUF1680 family protein
LEKGYAVIDRKWKKGDVLKLELPMKVRLVAGNPRIEDTRNKAVIMHGPMVYCIEETDNKHYFDNGSEAYLLSAGLNAKYRDNLLDGVVCINGKAFIPSKKGEINITAIPYYAWCNREPGQMKVWLPALME